MQLVCKHDPADPNHLICETKMPWRHWALEIGLGGLMMAFLVVSIVLFVKTPPVHKEGLEFTTVVGKGKDLEDGQAEQEIKQDDSPLYSGQITPYLVAEALYFSKEGEQLGRGPWPPQAREETRLKVFWRVAGAGADIVVEGKLGPHVGWTGFAPQAQGLSYEPATRIVRFIPRQGNIAVFEVAITPTAQQLEEKSILIVDNLEMVFNNRQILSPSIFVKW